MFFTRENETLYFTTFHYNVALILGELKTIIENNGGNVKPQTRGQIINRSFYAAAEEEKKRAEALRHYIELRKPEPEKLEKLENSIREHEAAAADLEKKAEESRRDAENLSYIVFTYNNNYYYLQIAELEMKLQFCKTPINNGQYSKDTYMEDLHCNWLYEDFYRLFTEKTEINEDRREAANVIFNALLTAKDSEKYRAGRKTRVPNTYNSGYHYETIYKPERIAKIDF